MTIPAADGRVELRPCRPFNLGDAMILIAALACWLSVMPGYFVSIPSNFLEVCETALRLGGWLPWSSEHPPGLAWMTLHLGVHNVLHGFRFLFGYLVVAVLVIGLRGAQPPFGDLLRQSGFGASLFLFMLPWIYLQIWWLNGEKFPYWIYLIFACILIYILLGRPPWRARAGWIDRLARVVAWYWVVAMVVWAVDEGYLERAY